MCRPSHTRQQQEPTPPRAAGTTVNGVPSPDRELDCRQLLDELRRANERLRAEAVDRERAEHEARLSEQRLKLALDIVNMGTWDWDILADTILWSDNVEPVHGLEHGSFDHRYESWLALVHPEDRARVSELVSAALTDGTGEYDAELRICRPDGEVRWLRARGQAYFDESSTPLRMVGTVVDITERRLAEDQLRRARDEADEARRAAETASTAKNSFLSRMSHELRTPLNAVLGFAQLLELDAVEEQRDSVQHIRKAGRHLLDLINEVLDISRIEAGQLTLSPEPVLVSEVVTEAVELVRPLADARGLTMASIDEASLERYVMTDRQRIKQVLLNLLSNAVKYNRDGGTITVTTRPTPDQVGRMSIAVHDTGLGIPTDGLDRLFLPFERLGAESTEIEGTGVGLTVTKRLVEAMGGEVVVTSEVGHGSVFTVTLPAAEGPRFPGPGAPGHGTLGGTAHQEPTGPRTSRSGESAPARWNLLSVEDNASNARLLERVVDRRPGWRLTSAPQGRLGLDLARSLTAGASLDLILLDLHLPDLHGTEVLRHLRADPVTARTPVVVLSADATPGAMARALRSGADAYLKKPFVVTELLEMLDTVAASGTVTPRG